MTIRNYLTADDLDAFKIGTLVYVSSALVGSVPYKKTRKGWQTFHPVTFRANGRALTSAELVERGAWT